MDDKTGSNEAAKNNAQSDAQGKTSYSERTDTRSDAARFHRATAVPRTLGTINPETDIRVRLLCRIVDKTVSGAIIEDVPQPPLSNVPAPQMEVVLEQDILSSIKPEDVIRIFARVLPLSSGFELRGELIQDMNGLDKEMYKRIYQPQTD